MIPDPDNTTSQILEPLSKVTEINKKQYMADVKVMNYLLQAIPNDICNSVDTCKNAKEMWERIKTLMYGSGVTNHVRHSRLMYEFDNFATKEGESLESVYEILTTLVNIMDRNNVLPIPVSINTKEQMLLSMKDEAGINLNDEENDFMLNNSFGDETLEELTAVVIMMARIQPTNDNAVTEPTYDAKATSEVNASHKMIPKGVYEHKNHRKRKTIIDTSDDDQVDSCIIFDDPCVENNRGSAEHDSNAHDPYHEIQILAYNVQREPENKKRLNNELRKQNKLLQKELETCQEWLAKKAFNEREDRYLKDIVDLEEKLSSHDRIVYKIGVGSSNSVRRTTSKGTKSRNGVLKNTKDKSLSTHVRKLPSSVRTDSNKHETMNSTVCQSNTSVLNTKIVNVVNDDLNIVCVSYGKDVFILSHEKCLACYALSIDSRVKRALFTTPKAVKSRNLGDTSVVAKSNISIAKTPTGTNKVSSVTSLSFDSSQSSGPYDTQYCMEDPEQAFVEYTSSRTNEAGEGLISNFMASQNARLTKFEADFKQQQSEMTNKIDTVLKVITDQIARALPSDTVKNPKLSTYPLLSVRSYPTEDPQCSTHVHGSINIVTICPKQPNEPQNDEPEEEEEKDNPENIHSLGLVPQSSYTELVCTKGDDEDVMFIEIVQKNDDSRKEELEAGEQEVEYFDVLPTRSELAYHKYLMCGPIPLIFLRNPNITEGCPSNLKIPCNIGHVLVERAYIDLNALICKDYAQNIKNQSKTGQYRTQDWKSTAKAGSTNDQCLRAKKDPEGLKCYKKLIAAGKRRQVE
uniref:MAK10-like protein n=1 Tax=Tanacetum cinerariifolium TaxID=118510 RepID=A0A6L2JHQ8_TANCI|nr:MAK10-like protein [Tanacetum cinerariifolium]